MRDDNKPYAAIVMDDGSVITHSKGPWKIHKYLKKIGDKYIYSNKHKLDDEGHATDKRYTKLADALGFDDRARYRALQSQAANRRALAQTFRATASKHKDILPSRPTVRRGRPNMGTISEKSRRTIAALATKRAADNLERQAKSYDRVAKTAKGMYDKTLLGRAESAGRAVNTARKLAVNEAVRAGRNVRDFAKNTYGRARVGAYKTSKAAGKAINKAKNRAWRYGTNAKNVAIRKGREFGNSVSTAYGNAKTAAGKAINKAKNRAWRYGTNAKNVATRKGRELRNNLSLAYTNARSAYGDARIAARNAANATRQRARNFISAIRKRATRKQRDRIKANIKKYRGR